MAFLYPLLLVLTIPSFIFCIWFGRIQYLSLEELSKSVFPAKVGKLTVFLKVKEGNEISFRNFWLYILFASLSILSLVVSLAGPYIPGDSQIQTKQTAIYLVFDGSWSMDANDVQHLPEYAYVPRFRFEEARFHAMELNKRLEDASFGVITFAGDAVQHSHPLPDKEWIQRILFDQMNSHNTFYSGTNYGAAFQELLNSSKYMGEGFQVVLYSDGDASAEEKQRALEMIKMFSRLKIPIHVVGLGTRAGAETELTYNLLSEIDTLNTVAGDAAGKEYQTSSTVSVQKRRSVPDFDFLETIARETQGEFILTSEGESGMDQLSEAIEKSKSKDQVLLWEAGGKKNLGFYFFLLPFLFFLYDFFWIRKAVKFGR
jgi:hypothetical protein